MVILNPGCKPQFDDDKTATQTEPGTPKTCRYQSQAADTQTVNENEIHLQFY